MTPELIGGFLAASVRVATPLALAATGETIAERSGVINLGIEGAMLAGALASALAATHYGVASGVVFAALAGMIVSALFAAIAVGARADQIISGTAVTLGLTGLTGLIAREAWGRAGAALSIPTMQPLSIVPLASIPWIGPGFFTQSALTYAAYAMVPFTAYLLTRTRAGLVLRACGESPAAAAAAGVRVGRVRAMATILGGAFAGVAGAALVLAQVGTFTERMTAGRGFIAIAIVVLGRWNPWYVAAAALLFGGATAVQFLFQAAGVALPYQVFIALPYLLALAVLAVAVGRGRGPAALGVAH